MAYAETHSGLEKGDYAILPRRKAGQLVPVGERAAVVMTRVVLEGYFGMPLSAAAKELVRIRFKRDRDLNGLVLTPGNNLIAGHLRNCGQEGLQV
jgi:hypothetical protein